MFSSCDSQQSVYPPDDHYDFSLEQKYNVDEDINIEISIGLCKDYQESYSSIENFKYVLAYSSVNPCSNMEEITILLIIEDFSSDQYYYTKTKDEFNYNFSELFTIKKEIFNYDTGEFYIFMFDMVGSDYNRHGFMMWDKIIYEKKEGSLFLQRSY